MSGQYLYWPALHQYHLVEIKEYHLANELTIRMNTEAYTIPKLSPNVEILPFGKTEYLVKQTLLQYQLKVNESTKEMLSLVDGVRTIADITHALSQKFDKPLDTLFVYKSLYEGNLARCGILETSEDIKQKKANEYIWLKVTLLKPFYISTFTRAFSFLFHPTLFAILFPVSLVYLLSVLIYFQDVQTIFNRFIQPENILIFYILMLASVFFHEMGHVSACRKFGAKHGNIGFGLYLIFPVFYADVSDAWKLARLQRFIIDMAGIYMELLVYSIITIIFFITGNAFILQLVFLRLLGTISNLNPFLRYDGYWALSDLINVPNLRSNANKKFTATVKWLFFNTPFPLLRPIDYFLSMYSAISLSFIVIFIAAALLVNPDAIIYFPVNLYEFFSQVIQNKDTVNGDTLRLFLYNFTMPVLFYIMVLTWLYSSISAFIKKRTNRPMHDLI